jgi:Na+/proline symporter
VNALDYTILVGTLLSIAAYAVWSTRGRADLGSYLKGGGEARWLTIGLSVMATQASAVTFLSTPGQGYESGLGFVQNYFGAPLALIVVSAFFLPIYRKLKVYTAYEYLGRRFDGKTRILGASLFLLQRGLGAGLTIYAPAIVLSTVFGWSLDATIILSGLLVVAYTVAGGCDAVSLTQKYQIGVIFAGMAAAAAVLVARLPAGLTLSDTLAIAGGYHKLGAVDFSIDPDRRYTVWTGVLGGMFLALSYFGTDQSQVQRYLGGATLRESRLGLMFNAVFKIPMQFFILFLGVLVFVFYRFERPPVFFDRAAWAHEAPAGAAPIEARFAAAHERGRLALGAWIDARHRGDAAAERAAEAGAQSAESEERAAQDAARKAVAASGRGSSDADYVFVTFILDHLPHGVIGLLVTAFFAAALSSKAGELNALGSATTIDIYRHLVKREDGDAHYLLASKVFTALWGLVAIGFALFARLSENLIQAVNIVGSIFYGVVLGIFLTAFFLKGVRGTAVFWAAILSQALVLVLYSALTISYLWYNVIGCAACTALALLIQAALGPTGREAEAPAT